MRIPAIIKDCYQPKWLDTETANRLEQSLTRFEFREYLYRASVLKRAPKCEFYTPFDDGTPPLYRWGQNRSEYASGKPFSDFPLLEELRERLTAETGETPNHCIVIRYGDGQKHHAPPHRDRQEGVEGNGARDMAEGTSFFVVTVGFPRLFTLLDERQDVVWQERLAHGSLLHVTAGMNRTYWHSVPRDPEQPADCPRYSLIFRSIRQPVANAPRRR